MSSQLAPPPQAKSSLEPSTTPLAPRVKQADPYVYGWRDEVETSPDGQIMRKRTPLTLHDILHPQVGDFRVHTDEHERIRTYLYNVFTMLVEDQPHTVVLQDTRVAWDVPGMDAHGPDLAVILNVRQHRNWSTFDVSEEGTRPSLIVEITSPRTRTLDIETKAEEYELVGVPFYVIIDLKRDKKKVTRTLIGYEMTPDGYLELTPDEQGHLWLPLLNASLAFEGERLVLYDAAGVRILDYKETARARRTAEAESKRARAQTKQAEAQARQAEMQTGQAEAQARQAEEKARQAEEKARQAEEKAAQEERMRAEVEERLQRAEAELRKLRGQS